MRDLRTDVQALINSLDQGAAHVTLRLVLFVCMGVAVFGAYAWSQFRGFSTPDAMDAAQLGRNLAAGEGFSTDVLRPVDTWHLERHTGTLPPFSRWPELRQAPAYPLLLAAGFKLVTPPATVPSGAALFPAEWMVVLPIGLLLSLATALAVYFLARALFDDRTAVLSMVVTLLSEGLLSMHISGTALPLATFLVTACFALAVYAALAWEARRPWGLWAFLVLLAAVLAAAVFLTSYALFVVPLMILFWIYRSFDAARWAMVPLLVVVFAACVTPWLLRNRAVSGHWLGLAPYEILHDTPAHPDDVLDRTLEPSLNRTRITRVLRAEIKNSFGLATRAHLGLPAAGVMSALFLISLLQRFERREAETLKWHLVIAVLLLAPVSTMSARGDPSLVVVLFPVMMVYGTAAYVALAGRLASYADEMTRVLSAVLIGAVGLPALLTLVGPRAAPPYPPFYPPLAGFASGLVDEGEILCTDVPWATAWYGNRASCLLPARVEDVALLQERLAPCGVLYLARTASPHTWGDPGWWALRGQRVPEDFPLRHGLALPPGTDDQLLLSDGPRWQSSAPEASTAGASKGSMQ